MSISIIGSRKCQQCDSAGCLPYQNGSATPCPTCHGTGKELLKGEPFVKQRRLENIKSVVFDGDALQAGNTISYEDFLSGRMPDPQPDLTIERRH